jgi:hypothetical protein
MNIGEEICGEWLRHVRACGFVDYNVKLPTGGGEIDVVGIDLASRTVYACEVAVHLVTGLQYTRDGRPDNVERLAAKFRKDVAYVREGFPEYRHVFMLWSPVVRNQRAGSAHNQREHVREVVERVRGELDVELELVINERFQLALDELRTVARNDTKEHTSFVVRYLQVEEHLKRHLARQRGGSE